MLLNERDIERFWDKVEVKGNNDCWLWTACCYTKGYGSFEIGSRSFSAHRISYKLMVGPIPEGLEIDHLCHTEAVKAGTCQGGPTCVHRRCVNPAHLELVTNAENTARGMSGGNNSSKTHCPAKHPYDEENTYVASDGSRKCRACRRTARQRYRRRHRQSVPT